VEASGTNEPPNETPAEAPAPAAPAETPAQAAPAAASIGQTAEQRKATLDRALQLEGAHGWRIETRSDFQATIAKGNRLNNTLHLLLTIFTAGLWGIVWIGLAIFGGIKRRMITIDEYGNIIDNKL
jgi:hypothetical protein